MRVVVTEMCKFYEFFIFNIEETLKFSFILQEIKSLNYDEPGIDDEMYNTAVKLLYIADRIDFMDEVSMKAKPTILIFLPGIYEISCMAKHIEISSKNL